jgi:hypothetical protein
MKGISLGILLAGVLLASSVPAFAASLPVDTLDGDPTSVPDGLAAGPKLLVIAFTKGARKQTDDWDAHLAALCKSGTPNCYDVAVVEGMPSFVMDMAIGRMRDKVPPAERAHHLLAMKGTADWQQLAAAPATPGDDAYLVLLGGDGKVRWRGHGPWTAAAEAELRNALKTAP